MATKITERPTIVVVYTKSKRPNAKKYLQVFTEERTVDNIINGNARKPLIPHEYEILDIGVGSGFIDKYKQKYKL